MRQPEILETGIPDAFKAWSVTWNNRTAIPTQWPKVQRPKVQNPDQGAQHSEKKVIPEIVDPECTAYNDFIQVCVGYINGKSTKWEKQQAIDNLRNYLSEKMGLLIAWPKILESIIVQM